MRSFVLTLGLMLLAACSSSVPRDLQNGQKTVAVLSFVGGKYSSLENVRPSDASIQQRIDQVNAALPTLDARDIDYHSFYAGSQEKRWTHDVTDWGIDRYAVDAVRAQLGKKFRVVDFTYDPTDLDYKGQHAPFVHDSAALIADAIRRQAGYAGAQNVDAYVVILPAEQDFTILDRRSQGIGMIRDFLAFAPGQQIGDGVYMLHALYNVAVFDGRTLDFLAVQTAKSETLYQNRFRGNPAVFVDNSYWAESYQQLTDAKRDKIVPQIKQMIDDTLPATLQELDLLP
jgi:hypothetical protein